MNVQTNILSGKCFELSRTTQTYTREKQRKCSKSNICRKVRDFKNSYISKRKLKKLWRGTFREKKNCIRTEEKKKKKLLSTLLFNIIDLNTNLIQYRGEQSQNG